MSLLKVTDYKKQRRSATHYSCQLPVIFNWEEEGKHTGAGFTSDVSLDGVSIQSTVAPPVGSDVSIEVLVPSPNDVGEQLRVQCFGKVDQMVRHFGGYSFGVKGIFDDQIKRTNGLSFRV